MKDLNINWHSPSMMQCDPDEMVVDDCRPDEGVERRRASKNKSPPEPSAQARSGLRLCFEAPPLALAARSRAAVSRVLRDSARRAERIDRCVERVARWPAAVASGAVISGPVNYEQVLCMAEEPAPAEAAVDNILDEPLFDEQLSAAQLTHCARHYPYGATPLRRYWKKRRRALNRLISHRVSIDVVAGDRWRQGSSALPVEELVDVDCEFSSNPDSVKLDVRERLLEAAGRGLSVESSATVHRPHGSFGPAVLDNEIDLADGDTLADGDDGDDDEDGFPNDDEQLKLPDFIQVEPEPPSRRRRSRYKKQNDDLLHQLTGKTQRNGYGRVKAKGKASDRHYRALVVRCRQQEQKLLKLESAQRKWTQEGERLRRRVAQLEDARLTERIKSNEREVRDQVLHRLSRLYDSLRAHAFAHTDADVNIPSLQHRWPAYATLRRHAELRVRSKRTGARPTVSSTQDTVNDDDQRRDLSDAFTFDGKHYKCLRCIAGKRFARRAAVLFHLKHRCLADRENSRCPRCMRVFKCPQYMERHLLRCTATADDPVCTTCKKRVRNMRQHKALCGKAPIEKGIYYECGVCGKHLESYRSYRSHVQRGTCSIGCRNSSRQLTCPLCPGPESFSGGQVAFVGHLARAHRIACAVGSAHFAGEVDMENWLLDAEKATGARFKTNGMVRRCHMWRATTNVDGTLADGALPGFGVLCPAFVFPKIEPDGSVRVHFCFDHHGHKRQEPSKRLVTLKIKDFMAAYIESNPNADDVEVIQTVRDNAALLGNVVYEYTDNNYLSALQYVRTNAKYRAEREERLAKQSTTSDFVLYDEAAPAAKQQRVAEPMPQPAAQSAPQPDDACPAGFEPYTPDTMRVVRQLGAQPGEADEPAPMALEWAKLPGHFLRLTALGHRSAEGRGRLLYYGCFACGRLTVCVHQPTGRVYYQPSQWRTAACTGHGSHPLFTLVQLAGQELELIVRRALCSVGGSLSDSAAAARVRQQCTVSVKSVAAQFHVPAAALQAHLDRIDVETLKQWDGQPF